MVINCEYKWTRHGFESHPKWLLGALYRNRRSIGQSAVYVCNAKVPMRNVYLRMCPNEAASATASCFLAAATMLKNRPSSSYSQSRLFAYAHRHPKFIDHFHSQWSTVNRINVSSNADLGIWEYSLVDLSYYVALVIHLIYGGFVQYYVVFNNVIIVQWWLYNTWSIYYVVSYCLFTKDLK